MAKIKELIKETNGLAIFSFLLSIFAWVFSDFIGCSSAPSTLAFAAFLVGIVALIWLKRKKQKGAFLATFGIFLGFVGTFLLVTMC